MLSPSVCRTTYEGQEVLFHLVTKKWLPVHSNKEILYHNFFLDGQEEEALDYRLDIMRNNVPDVHIVPTWACNLRCGHCAVVDRLTIDSPEIDVVATCNFVREFMKENGKTGVHLAFIGGESLLAAEKCLEILSNLSDVVLAAGLTTNLTIDLTETHWKLFEEMEAINVSLDGAEEVHNAQRIAMKPDFNPFLRTIGNIKRLVIKGYQDKLFVQGVLKDNVNKPEIRKELVFTLLRLGVSIKRLKVGSAYPSPADPAVQSTFLDGLKIPVIRLRPCCKYRFYNIVVDCFGKVYSDATSWTEIGTIHDPVATIFHKKENLIQRMSVRKDPKCMRCEALGVCWGNCCYVDCLNGMPSFWCNQKNMVELVYNLAKQGTIIDQAISSRELRVGEYL